MIATLICLSDLARRGLVCSDLFLVHSRGGVRDALRDGLQQFVEAVAVFRRNGKHIVRKLVERRGERFLHLRVDFVRQDRQRLPCAAQQARQLGIERRQPRAHIHNQQELRSAFDGHLRLAKDFARDGGLVVRHDPARIDDFERALLPGRRAVDAVARNSRLVGNNRAPRARQPVENRGFADIGPANNHYRWKFFSHVSCHWGHNEP